MRFLIICFMFCACSPSRMIQTDLYFGQTIPGGGMVTNDEWNHFVQDYVSKVYKEGSTTVSATGAWYDPDAKKLITEPSYVISSLHKPSAAISKQIDSLRYWYKTLFKQQSVLRVDRKVKASF